MADQVEGICGGPRINLGRLKKRYTDPKLVLIYQFGKVGSTTLADSIEGAVNVHDLFGNHLCPCGFRQRNKFFYRKLVFPVDRAMRRRWIRGRATTNIIVPLREPWKRNVSMFFQDLPFWYVEHFIQNRAVQKREGLGLLREIFEQTFDHDGCEHWFDREFSKLTSISLSEIPFDRDGGFSIVEKNGFRCLFLTTSLMSSDAGKKCIESFLDRPIELNNQNRGDQKWYGPVYRQFLEDESFVDEYRQRMSGSRVHQKFFA